MDCNSFSWNACQGTDQARESQNGVRYLLFNVKYNDQFIEVNSSIGCPIEVSHCVKITVFGSVAPDTKKRTHDGFFLDKFFETVNDINDVGLNVVFDLLIFDMEKIFQEFIE